MLCNEPPPGIGAWASSENALELEAVIQGAEGTPYARGSFKLCVLVPERYPFEPPKVHFVTPIYHPNIDSAGRICLDTLNMPPKGAWKPSLNISTVLVSIQLLMSHPNPDDGLMVDIVCAAPLARPPPAHHRARARRRPGAQTHEYIHNHPRFERTATERTRMHACETQPGSAAGEPESAGGSKSGGDGGGSRAGAVDAPAPATGDAEAAADAASKRQRVG